MRSTGPQPADPSADPTDEGTGPEPAESSTGPQPAESSTGPQPAESSTGPQPAESSTGPQRRTRQQAAVADVMSRLEDFRSAQQIHALLRDEASPVGLATVYRTLQSMADLGRVDTLRTGEGEQLYRQCSTGHHHHLVCRSCGRTVEVSAPEVERWAAEAARANGFRDVRHDLEVYGTCGSC